MNRLYQFVSLTLNFRGAKIENFVKCEREQKLGKNKIENMLPTKVCMFCELSEPFYFLRCVICILAYFSSCTGTYPFMFNFVHTFSKLKLPPPPPGSGRQVFLFTVNKPDVYSLIKVILLSALMSTRLSQDDQTRKGSTRQIQPYV